MGGRHVRGDDVGVGLGGVNSLIRSLVSGWDGRHNCQTVN